MPALKCCEECGRPFEFEELKWFPPPDKCSICGLREAEAAHVLKAVREGLPASEWKPYLLEPKGGRR